MQNKLQEFRKKNCLSIQKLAETVGVSYTAIWQILNGRQPNLTTAMKIQKATGISFEDMLKKE
jgi:DNA-binding XRE family transcriptional regulator